MLLTEGDMTLITIAKPTELQFKYARLLSEREMNSPCLLLCCTRYCLIADEINFNSCAFTQRNMCTVNCCEVPKNTSSPRLHRVS